MDVRFLNLEAWKMLDLNARYVSNHDLNDDNGAPNREQLRSEIRKYFNDKLAKKLNMSSISTPWSKIKEEDILNWPQDVKFRTVWNLKSQELLKLHKLAEEDKLDFSNEFLTQFKRSKVNNNRNRRSDRIGVNTNRNKRSDRIGTGLRLEIQNYLSDKLAKRLNVSSLNVPWSKIKSEDIINWPQDVKFRTVQQLSTQELETLHELVKENALDFSPEFLRLRELQLRKNEKRRPNLIIKAIETALCKKLSAGTNVNFKRVPWNIIRKQDMINWPDGVPFLRLSQQGRKRLKLLHKLREVISFSEEFLQRLSDPSWEEPIRRYIKSDNLPNGGRSEIRL